MGVPWQKSISGFVNLPEDGRRKRVVEKFASIARGEGGGEQEEEKEEEERKGRRMLPATTSGEVEGIKRGYPLVRHCFSSGTSWRMHHLAVFSTTLFHSGAASRILRCRNIDGTWPTGCCQNNVPRTSRHTYGICMRVLSSLLLSDG